MLQKSLLLLLLPLLLAGCAGAGLPAPTSTSLLAPGSTGPLLALVNGTLIDGSGAPPLPDAVLLIRDGRILAAGPSQAIALPSSARRIDLGGATILPGFINAHVHDAFDAGRLAAWAQAGVTTVRDEGLLGGQLESALALRRSLAGQPGYARLVSAGMMISPRAGYGQLYADTPAEGRQRVQEQAALGVEQIKIALESGYGGTTGLPLLSDETIAAILEEAHARGLRVSAHITSAGLLERVVRAGVDDAAHATYDSARDPVLAEMVRKGIPVVSTLTVFEAYGSLAGAQASLGRMLQAGVVVALGNDYTRIPQAGFDHFDLGMPLHEITRLSEAGLTPMQIILAGTKNAAAVCGLENELGTLQPGRQADVLVVDGDPLADLTALGRPLWVLHAGVVIRQP